MKTKSLVIGANSFIGNNLTARLNESSDVVGVFHHHTDRLTPGIEHIAIKDLNGLEPDFDQVYIVSAYIKPGKLDKKARLETFQANVELVAEICNKFAKSRIILCSSVSVYEAQTGIINEKSSKGCLNEYGVSKLWSEMIVGEQDNYAIVRFSSVFGPGMNSNTIIPIYITQAREKKEIVVYGEGKRLQDYLHVKDAVGFLQAAGQSSINGEFLACSSRSYSNLELAEMIAAETGCKISFKGEDHSSSFLYNNSDTVKKLNYSSRFALTEEIKEIIKWIEKEF